MIPKTCLLAPALLDAGVGEEGWWAGYQGVVAFRKGKIAARLK